MVLVVNLLSHDAMRSAAYATAQCLCIRFCLDIRRVCVFMKTAEHILKLFGLLVVPPF